MSTNVRIVLFLCAVAAGLLVTAVLMDLISVSDAQVYGLKIGGVFVVGYLVLLAGSLLLRKDNVST
jgi:hypothetical protein